MVDRFTRHVRRSGDRGVAMIVAVVIAAIVAGLGATVTTLSINNLQNAGRDTHAGGALNLAEAGTTQGIEFLRGSNPAILTCREAVYALNPADPTCNTGVVWSGPNSPKIVTDGTGKQFAVWISVKTAPTPPATGVGTYVIRSTGTSGGVTGSRTVLSEATVRPFRFPLAVYGDAITAGGSLDAVNISILSLTCVNQREKIDFADGLDAAYGIPTAVHTAGNSTKAENNCADGDIRNIHKLGICNPNIPPYVPRNHVQWDQDSEGGPLSATNGAACWGGSSGAYPQTSKFTAAMLRDQFDYRPNGLSNAEYDALRARAQAMGQFYQGTTVWTAPDPAVYPNAVMFFDLRNTGGDVNFNQNNIPGYTTSTCGTRSLVIVVLGGDMTLNGGVDMTGSMFVPNGNIKGTGGANIIGSVFAKSLEKILGGAEFKLAPCFLDNFPPALRTVSPSKFREVDR